MRHWSGLLAAPIVWISITAPALAESGSRYSAPLWTWLAAVGVSAGLAIVGLVVGRWFLRKRQRLEASKRD